MAVDLLARGPDEDERATGVHADLQQRSLRLEPGAHVRYRIEPRAPGAVHLAARAAGPGNLDAAWFALDLAGGGETLLARQTIELEEAGSVERDFWLPSIQELLELRLAWHSAADGAALELQQLGLHESAPVARPPIVLIVIDTLSAQHLSAYGYSLETDPELKRFASEAFLFENCFSNAPWTVPSFMSLMTGLYSRAHELAPGRGMELWERWYLAQNRWTLAECLRAGGYRTAGYVDNNFLSNLFGFGQGFDVYDDSAAHDTMVLKSDPDGGIRKTTALANAFLAGLGADTPFFLFVHALDVHQPYTEQPPADKRSRGTEPYDTQREALAGGSAWAYDIVPTLTARVAVPEGPLPSKLYTAPIERAYDEGVRFVDEELGKFFDHLRATGVLDRAWVVLTADHGETMSSGVHWFGHGILSQDVMHVPLLVRPPGGTPGGKRIPETTQLADLYPTLLELAGIPSHGLSLHGASLVPLLRGEPRAPDVVLAESGNIRQAMLVAGGWKLVELEPTMDSPPEARISNPLLAREFARTEAELRKGITGRGPKGPEATKHWRRYLAWTEDVELRRDYFERMPVTGLTEELLEQMKTRKGFWSFLNFVDRALQGPFYELYHLEVDPLGKQDVAAQYPEKVTELKTLLEQEKQRRAAAWRSADQPARRVEIPAADVQALEALGYGGAGSDDAEHDEDE